MSGQKTRPNIRHFVLRDSLDDCVRCVIDQLAAQEQDTLTQALHDVPGVISDIYRDAATSARINPQH